MENYFFCIFVWVPPPPEGFEGFLRIPRFPRVIFCASFWVPPPPAGFEGFLREPSFPSSYFFISVSVSYPPPPGDFEELLRKPSKPSGGGGLIKGEQEKYFRFRQLNASIWGFWGTPQETLKTLRREILRRIFSWNLWLNENSPLKSLKIK